MSRWLLFFLTMAAAAAAGLYYGWVVNPVQYVDTYTSSLRADYKADYVLMVAEAYQAEDDLFLAMRRLAALGDAAPEESVNKALLFAISVNPPYSQVDLAKMQNLYNDLQAGPPRPETPQP
jgi:hypothetical protein